MNSVLKKAESGEPITYEDAKELQTFKDLEGIFQTARDVANDNHGKKIRFYKNAFLPISITGVKCDLNCIHCGRHYLEHMIQAPTEDRLIQVCKNLDEMGVQGIVLSGGSRRDGTVPLDEFAGAIRRIKKETDLTILAHTGPVNDAQATALGNAGLDGALIDVVGSSSTTEEVYGVRIPPAKYAQSLKALGKSGIKNISPHVIVGLHFGKIKGEIKALELLSNSPLDNIVIVVLIPTRGTMMHRIEPPLPTVVGRIIAIAQLMYPSVPIALGCVRPGGMYRKEIDKYALRAGASKLAIPTYNAGETVKEELGLKVKMFEQMCCAWM